MKKNILIFLAIIFFAPLSFSQHRFLEGYIVNQENDTLKGLVKYQRDLQPHYICKFKHSEKDTILSYDARDIKGYGFDVGIFFRSINLDIYEYHFDINFDLEKLLKPKDYHKFKTHEELINQNPEKDINILVKELNDSLIDKQPLFLKALVEGKVSLYKHGDNYFVRKGEGKFHLFMNLDEDDEDEDSQAKLESLLRRQKGILRVLMSDCPEIFNMINQVILIDKSMINLVEEYNSCTNSPYYVYDPGLPLLNFRPGLVFGYHNTHWHNSINNIYSFLEGTTMSSEPNTAFGVSLEVTFPRRLNNYSLLIEGYYFRAQLFGSYEEVTRLGNNIYHDISFSFNELMVPVSLRYTLPNVFLNPYFNAGAFCSYHLNVESYHIQDHVADGSTYLYRKNEDIYPFADFHFGLMLGAGAQKSIINNLSTFFEIRYVNSGRFVNKSSPFTPENFKTNKRHWMFALGLKL